MLVLRVLPMLAVIPLAIGKEDRPVLQQLENNGFVMETVSTDAKVLIMNAEMHAMTFRMRDLFGECDANKKVMELRSICQTRHNEMPDRDVTVWERLGILIGGIFKDFTGASWKNCDEKKNLHEEIFKSFKTLLLNNTWTGKLKEIFSKADGFPASLKQPFTVLEAAQCNKDEMKVVLSNRRLIQGHLLRHLNTDMVVMATSKDSSSTLYRKLEDAPPFMMLNTDDSISALTECRAGANKTYTCQYSATSCKLPSTKGCKLKE